MKTPPAVLSATLASGAAVVVPATLVASLPDPDAAVGAADRPSTTVGFTLEATVLDGGEQVTAITLDTGRLGRIDPASLTASTFTVHATATSPVPIANGEVISSLYDVDRTVTGVTVDRHGDVVVDLAYGAGVAGASTLGYLSLAARTVDLDLTYTVTQNAPVLLTSGRSVTLSGFEQGALRDAEVDAFSSGVSATGLSYRLFEPTGRSLAGGARPLVVWLHGNGEGGLPGYYSNEPQLRGNRGALGPATPEAQAVFGGAYVVAPQVPDTWYNLDESAYAERLAALLDELAESHRIDASRVYVMGASAGGFMSVKLASAYPERFAALVPTCAALYLAFRGGYLVTEAEIRRLSETPTWFVHAENDPTVPFAQTSLWAHGLVAGSVLTSYADVTWDGVGYNGHWSWIYTARNAPTTADGATLWEWMAQQDADA